MNETKPNELRYELFTSLPEDIHLFLRQISPEKKSLCLVLTLETEDMLSFHL